MERDRKESLLRALGDVGDDLVEMAGNYRASAGWKRWGAVAASLALVICLTAVALPYLPMGCSSADKSSPEANAPMTPEAPNEPPYTADKENSMADQESVQDVVTTYSAVMDAVVTMDMQQLTEMVATPLIRWQVGPFASAADLSEDAMERLYLAVMEREEPWRDPASASVGEIRKKLSQVLEGVHIYAPLNQKLPLNGALKELPRIEPQFLYVNGDTVRLEVLVDGRFMTFLIRMNEDGWRYVRVD